MLCCVVVCLGSHRVGINNPHSGIPQNLRNCVRGDPANSTLVLICVYGLVCNVMCCFQRSVTSVCLCRVIRRGTIAVWTVRALTPACVNPGGRVSTVSRVSQCKNDFEFVFLKLYWGHWHQVWWQCQYQTMSHHKFEVTWFKINIRIKLYSKC